MARRWRAALSVMLVAVAACTSSGQSGTAAIEPRDGRSGLSLTGTVEGRQIAIADGLPRLESGCSPPQRGDDVCVISRTIDGELFVLVFENPSALAAGADLPVEDRVCTTPQECEDITDAAIVEIQFDTEDRIRATEGRVTIREATTRERYAGELQLGLPDGRLSGTFDVIPRPDDDEEPGL